MSKVKATAATQPFMKRFHKLQKKVGDDEAKFTQALNGWFDLAAGGIKFRKYKAKFGEDAIRLLATHLVKGGLADDPQGMFEQIKQSKTLDALVQQAQGTNPASMYRAHQAHEAAALQRVLANPKGAAAPEAEQAEVMQLLQDKGLAGRQPQNRATNVGVRRRINRRLNRK